MKTLESFDWAEVKTRWGAFHRSENRGPVFNCVVHPPEGSVKQPKKYWAHYDFSIPAGTILAEMESYIAHCRFLGEGYPSQWLDFGPGVLAAMIGGEGCNGDDTVWFSPGRFKDVPIADMHIELDHNSCWLARIEEFCSAAAKRWGGAIQLGMTDLGSGLDVLSALLPGEGLLYALYDSPDEVKRLAGEVQRCWFDAFDRINGLLPENPGYSAWDGTFSADPYYMFQCDFCYMISPEMFGEFVLEELAGSCRRLPRSFYHLDGKGELPHLPQILTIPELGGVQWVPGTGMPLFTEWPEVYRAIAAADKKIWLAPNGDFEGAARLIGEIGRPGLFMINCHCSAEGEAKTRAFIERFSS